jgi:hypothetical protein
VKVTLRNFGRDRRYPITNRFRDPGTAVPKPDTTLFSGQPVAQRPVFPGLVAVFPQSAQRITTRRDLDSVAAVFA